MNKKRALISGCSGMDGSHLTEFLLEKDYEVFGIVRRHSVAENQNGRLHHIQDKMQTFYGDTTDPYSLAKIMKKVYPDEIYHLAAQSHVRISFDIPAYTAQANALGTLHMLEVYKDECPGAKFYNAASSEMFGNNTELDGSQCETTLMDPVSVYGCTKVFAYNLARHFRRAYGLFICNGILFNHESPRRGINFVTNKVVKAAVDIKLGRSNKLYLGNLDASRDWGYAGDYISAMYMMLQHTKPDDYVVATGVSHTVKDLCKYVFTKLGMNWEDYVRVDEKYYRAEELKQLRGDSSKIEKVLGWKAEISFETLLDEMIEHALVNSYIPKGEIK